MWLMKIPVMLVTPIQRVCPATVHLFNCECCWKFVVSCCCLPVSPSWCDHGSSEQTSEWEALFGVCGVASASSWMGTLNGGTRRVVRDNRSSWARRSTSSLGVVVRRWQRSERVRKYHFCKCNLDCTSCKVKRTYRLDAWVRLDCPLHDDCPNEIEEVRREANLENLSCSRLVSHAEGRQRWCSPQR